MAHVVLVPTPVGNLGDITRRAVEVLGSADVVAAEDTRHSGRLLEHLGIDRPLRRLDAHTMSERAPRLLAEAAVLAYITDAGTPGISDPGAELVAMALAAGHTVEVLPGATALIPALVLSGLPTNRFTFEGFLPRKGGARRERLEAIAASAATTVLYESPARAAATLRDLAAACGPERPAAVTRELSKRFEATHRGFLSELAELGADDLRGEIVIVVGPADTGGEAGSTAPAALAELAGHLARHGLDTRAVREALLLAGAPRNVAYDLSLQAARDDGV